MRPFKYGCVVDGENFCARPELERQLQEYAKSGQNLVINGARRMGKTSLVRHAIRSMKGVRLIYIDLYCIRTQADFCARAMKGISKSASEMSFIKKALGYAVRLRPVLAIDPQDGSPTITVDAKAAEAPDSLDAVMLTLEKLSSAGNTCVVFDEFQDILKLESPWKILAEMRSSIQFQANTPYFFTGSLRNDMMRIFDDPDSPFFKSALPFAIDEINPVEFSKFLASKFIKAGRKITLRTISSIISFADGVSGDVQELCDALYECSDNGEEISEAKFEDALALLFSREIRGYESIVEELTPQQLKVLKTLAVNGLVKAYSSEFCTSVGMLPSTVKRIITRLTDNRIVYVRHGEYRFFNPFFREWLKTI